MISPFEVVIRLGCALVLSGIVGFEREQTESSAGLRTHAMVGLGSALFALVSLFGFGDAIGMPHANFDPSRVSSLVVSGIGFLCAGAIINSRGNVRGLTTAASLWTCAALGLAAGSGMFLAAAFTTVGAIFLLFVVKLFEKKYSPQRHGLWLFVSIGHDGLGAFVSAVEKFAPLKEVRVASSDETKCNLEVHISPEAKLDPQRAVLALAEIPGVRQVRALV